MMSQDAAETLAARFLDWLAADHARIASFLAWSGETPAGLRSRAGLPEVALAVIDFVLADEAMLLEACRDLGLKPETPMQARAALPGGVDPHWT